MRSVADLTAEVEPVTRQIAARAAQLRAEHGDRLRLPEGLVLATGLQLRADRVLTTDSGWPDVGITICLIGS